MEKLQPHDLVPIRLEAEIDMSVTPNECRIKAIHGSPWVDLAYWLEAVGWLCVSAAEEKQMTKAEIADYARDYIFKCLNDYK